MKLVVLTVALTVCAVSNSDQRGVSSIWEMERRGEVEAVNPFQERELDAVNPFQVVERELDDVVEVKKRRRRTKRCSDEEEEEEHCSENAKLCAMHVQWERCGMPIIQAQCPCSCPPEDGGDNTNDYDDTNDYDNNNHYDDNTNGISSSEKIMLDRHNELRRNHGVPALTYDKTLAAKAKEWCQYLASTSKFEHSDQSNAVEYTGENLYYYKGAPEETIPLKSVNRWYDEIEDYDFNNPGFSYETGHFTQLLWKETQRLGCYSTKKAANRKKRVYACCEYGPPGNYRDEFRENVPRPISG